MSTHGKFLSVFIALALAIPGAVQAQIGQFYPIDEKETDRSESVLTINAAPTEQEASLKFWTAEARAAAQPLDFATEQLGPTESMAGDGEVGSKGSAGYVLGGEPKAGANEAAQMEYPEEWAKLLEMETGLKSLETPEGTPAIYTSYLVNFYTQMHRYYPYYAIGKLYFTTSTGGSAYCTASVISPNNILVTAAHCVYDTSVNRWHTNWSFVPADRAGVAPYGSFPWASATVLNNWMGAGGTRYDVALIKLGNNSVGNPVSNYTGWLGRVWNYSYVRHLHAFGYPSNLNSGRYTYTCGAETFSESTDVLGMGCNMTYGSSGGPWIMSLQPYATGANNYVNAVVSGGTPGTNTFYGPRFSSNNIVPLCNAAGC